jgi:hypothetical protein
LPYVFGDPFEGGPLPIFSGSFWDNSRYMTGQSCKAFASVSNRNDAAFSIQDPTPRPTNSYRESDRVTFMFRQKWLRFDVPTPSGVTAPNPVTTTLRIASRQYDACIQRSNNQPLSRMLRRYYCPVPLRTSGKFAYFVLDSVVAHVPPRRQPAEM